MIEYSIVISMTYLYEVSSRYDIGKTVEIELQDFKGFAGIRTAANSPAAGHQPTLQMGRNRGTRGAKNRLTQQQRSGDRPLPEERGRHSNRNRRNNKSHQLHEQKACRDVRDHVVIYRQRELSVDNYSRQKDCLKIYIFILMIEYSIVISMTYLYEVSSRYDIGKTVDIELQDFKSFAGIRTAANSPAAGHQPTLQMERNRGTRGAKKRLTQQQRSRDRPLPEERGRHSNRNRRNNKSHQLHEQKACRDVRDHVVITGNRRHDSSARNCRRVGRRQPRDEPVTNNLAMLCGPLHIKGMATTCGGGLHPAVD
ncbi:uncharacterized protein LOC133353393 isoform X3 [Lethenteron reissneri]|uniref:uncharacterized protein LOC133353393 isoform X3 n=1 Tax=Lethenteron reissneri TaxID=7753 RepID=UPI002AB6BB04|nr:uncharacterized protein LOC133353393 isoform X3 [Lethenteron reissneri]